MDVTRQDIDRIHERLDEIRDDQATMKADIAVLKDRQATAKTVSLPDRPCPFFITHIEEHKTADAEAKKLKQGILGWAADKVLSPLLAAAGTAAALLWGRGQ